MVKDVAHLETGSEVVTQSDTNRVLSWLSPQQSSRDLFCDAAAVRSSISPVALPLTTVWVESDAATNRCSLHIKRVYISMKALSGVGPSRGDYEALYLSVIRSRLPGIAVSPLF